MCNVLCESVGWVLVSMGSMQHGQAAGGKRQAGSGQEY